MQGTFLIVGQNAGCRVRCQGQYNPVYDNLGALTRVKTGYGVIHRLQALSHYGENHRLSVESISQSVSGVPRSCIEITVTNKQIVKGIYESK